MIYYKHNEYFRQGTSETRSIEIHKVENDEMGTSELTTPENTVIYHNTPCLSPQNFA